MTDDREIDFFCFFIYRNSIIGNCFFKSIYGSLTFFFADTGNGKIRIVWITVSALALIPLAFRGDLPGNEIQSPMAKVILGGLLTSTFLNAFIIPIVYELMNRKKK